MFSGMLKFLYKQIFFFIVIIFLEMLIFYKALLAIQIVILFCSIYPNLILF